MQGGPVDFGHGVPCFSNIGQSIRGCSMQTGLSVCVAPIIVIVLKNSPPLMKTISAVVNPTFKSFFFTIVSPPLKFFKSN